VGGSDVRREVAVAFADYDAYLAALRANTAADFQMSGATVSQTQTRFQNLSRLFVPSPGVPTASAALDKDTLFAMNGSVPNAGAGRLSILGARLNPSGTSGVAVMMVDMLNISGGLDATSTAAQTTNLPTAALTRYTSGDGVHAALVVHAIVGTSATTFTVSYTNQAGTSGRISTASQIGATGFRELGALLRIPLEAGDTGIRSVESVTLTATTGTIGNFGVILYKPLAFMLANDVEGANVIDCVSTGRMVGQLNEVLDDACLSVFGVMPAVQAISGVIVLGEA
jgi:hypothetical protein